MRKPHCGGVPSGRVFNVRILFVLKQMGYLRHFDSVVETLAAKGHTVRIATQDGVFDLPETLANNPNITVAAGPKKRGDLWQEHTTLIRRAADYLRYVEPAFVGATKLRGRAFDKLVKSLSQDQRTAPPEWSDLALGLTADERQRLKALFAAVEAVIPSDERHEAFLRAESPDLVLVTPLIDIGSAQTEFIKSARALGIPSGMVLFSWDNLTTKGRVHDVPDAVFVWNELQRREAIDLHDIPAARIAVTGAPRFDAFFAMTAGATRAEYCERLGLDPIRPIVTYLGSSKFVSVNERAWIATWIDRVRAASDPVLRDCTLVIKPHPDLHRDWDDAAPVTARWKRPGHEMRAVVTRPFGDPNAVVVRSAFTGAQFLYDCLFHSAAVVGLNTSAELEAAIVGRPVCTIKTTDAIADGQGSTLHFHYLLKENGGFVEVAADLDGHLAQLADAVNGRVDRARLTDFVQSFLRPNGVDRRATDVFVEAIETRFASHPLVKPSVVAVTSNVEPSADAAAADATTRDGRVRLDYRPVEIWLHATSDMERKWRARTCAKEPWTVAWIENHVFPGDVFYDIGANVGAFSLIAAKRLHNDVRVVAFEPGYATFAHLCDNIVDNGCQSSILPVPLPLSSETGLAGFKYRTLDPGQSRHALIDRAWGRPSKNKNKVEARYTQPVLAVRLDDMVEQYGLPHPTHIKLDVDGAELRVLEGASRVLESPSIKTLLIEIDRDLAVAVAQLLQHKRFTLVEQYQREKKDNAPAYSLYRRS